MRRSSLQSSESETSHSALYKLEVSGPQPAESRLRLSQSLVGPLALRWRYTSQLCQRGFELRLDSSTHHHRRVWWFVRTKALPHSQPLPPPTHRHQFGLFRLIHIREISRLNGSVDFCGSPCTSRVRFRQRFQHDRFVPCRSSSDSHRNIRG